MKKYIYTDKGIYIGYCCEEQTILYLSKIKGLYLEDSKRWNNERKRAIPSMFYVVVIGFISWSFHLVLLLKLLRLTTTNYRKSRNTLEPAN